MYVWRWPKDNTDKNLSLISDNDQNDNNSVCVCMQCFTKCSLDMEQGHKYGASNEDWTAYSIVMNLMIQAF